MNDCVQSLRIDSDLLSTLSASMSTAADTIDWLMKEFKNQEPLKESYSEISALCLDLLYEANKPKLYGEICDKIREHKFLVARNGYGKHSVFEEDN